jgi:hypothetical protein
MPLGLIPLPPMLGQEIDMPLPSLAKVIANNRSQQAVPTSSLNLTITGWTESFDTASAFDPVTGLFIAPADGYFQVDAGIVATSPTAAYGLAVLVNDVAKLQLINALAGGQSVVGGLVQLAKNDVLRFGITNFSGVNVTLFNNAAAPGANYLTIAQQL